MRSDTVARMEPGRLELEGVSRSFLVYPKPTRTLKELVVSRGRVPAREVKAIQDVSFSVSPGDAVGLVGRNGSGKSTLLRVISGILRPTAGKVAVGGRIASLLELGAGFQPEFTGRENVYLNGSILGLKQSTIREHMDEIVAFAELEQFIDLPVRTYSSGMQMRLGFAISAHLEADVLLLDEVFAVGDEAFQRKCFGKIFEFKQRGGTILFVSHDASSVERLCERAILLREGEVAFDGPTREAITQYHAQLADEHDPAERGAGLTEWGSREARIAAARLVGPDGADRLQFLAGEAFALVVTVEADEGIAAPVLTYELRDVSNLVLATGDAKLGEHGWNGSGTLSLRYDVPRPPLGDGRFHVRLGLTDASGEHLYHQLDRALEFMVYPGGDERGLVRLDGRWQKETA
jgi:ABC-type polysaccharide/polyol phosphate transport system ATPase subunit